jgi:hypothetical protein
MSALTNINEIINIETAACIERKLKTIRTKPRKAFEPGCKLEAMNKYKYELEAAIAEDNALSASLNDATMNAVNNRFPVWNIAAILIITSIILYIILKS